MIARLIEVGRCCGMEVNVENNKGDDNLKATIPKIRYDSSNTTAECGIFQLLG